MGTSLNGLTPAGTYPGLIKTGDNAPIDGTLKTLSDGNGNNLPMEASTTGINFTGNVLKNGLPLATPPSGVSGAIQFSNGSAFASDAANFFWDNTNKRLGIGTNNAYAATLQVKGVGTSVGTNAVFVENSAGLPALIVRNNGTVNLPGNLFAEADITVGNGNTSLGARLGIKGSGSTSATTSLLVQDSNASEILKLVDSGRLFLGANNYIGSGGEWRCDINFVVNGTLQNTNSGYVQLAKAYAQSGLVAGTTTLNASAILEGNSTTKGFLPPRMTTTQKNAIASPSSGLVVYDSTTNKLCCYNGSTWNDLF